MYIVEGYIVQLRKRIFGVLLKINDKMEYVKSS